MPHSHLTSGDPYFSIVIPTMDSGATLDACLSSVQSSQFEGLEVIVVDGGSTDDTLRIASDRNASILAGAFKRSSARRLGATESRGRFLFFLDSDQFLMAGVLSECKRILEADRLDALIVHESDEGSGIWSSCRIFERRVAAMGGLAYPRVVSRTAYLAVGGHRPGLEDFMEDRDLSTRLSDAGYRTGSTRGCIVNRFGTTNPLVIGQKGARTAVDAKRYFESNLNRPDSILRQVRLRVIGFLRVWRRERVPLATLLTLPLYLTVAQGPRFLRASIARIRLSDLLSRAR